MTHKFAVAEGILDGASELETMASALETNGANIDDLASEFANTPCEWVSEYAGIWDRRGHWWTDERISEFTAWVSGLSDGCW